MLGTFEPITVPLDVDESGTVRLAGSRITLDTVLGCYRRGETPEEIAAEFPPLSAADLHAVVSYYLHHRHKVDTYLDQSRQEAAALRAVIDARPDNRALHRRLRERRAQMEAERRVAADLG